MTATQKQTTPTLLVFNCGSSSLGCKLYSSGAEVHPTPLFSAKAHRVGVTGSQPSFLECATPAGSQKTVLPLPDHRTAARRIIAELGKRGLPVAAAGHRFAHGGAAFSRPVVINDEVLRGLKRCAPLAPIHNPLALSVIAECRRSLPGCPQYAVFDNAFHASLPEWAHTYPVPRSVRERFHYRRYGFHGLSYSYVAAAAPVALGLPAETIRMVACHLGTGGSSVCAMEGGRSLDTSMGYSPLTGLPMSTRSGDVDPLLAVRLMGDYQLRPDDALELLSERSGLLGVAGFSSDLRDIAGRMSPESEGPADLAFAMYVHRLRKYIGSYVAALGGIDALVFTDDIGVTSWLVREKACEGMEWFGLRLDVDRNRAAGAGATSLVHAAGSGVQVLVMPTEEELVIARQGVELGLGVTTG